MGLMELKKLTATGRGIFDAPLRVAYYARVSTEKDEQLNSLSNQTRYYEDFIRGNGNWTFAGGYIDEGISATSVKKRDSFLRMIDDARQGKLDLIITKEISRFSRNTLDSIRYTRELLTYGVGVFFQNDNINTLDSDAELRLTIMASIAQDEVRKLSERTRFGFRRAQENGVLLGQDNLYGYDKRDGALYINEDEARIVRRVFERYAEGRAGLRAIARELEADGILSPSGRMFSYGTLYGMIKNPKYKGFYAGNRYTSADYRDNRKLRVGQGDWIVFRDVRIPAIVGEAVWDRANELLCERGRSFREHGDAFQNRYVYSGKIFCGEHGTSFHRHVYKSKRRGEVECWNCRLYRLKGKRDGCDSPTVYSYELDGILAGIYADIYDRRDALIEEYLGDLKRLEDERDIPAEISAAEAKGARITRKKDKLLELCAEGAITNAEFRAQNDALSAELYAVEETLERLRRDDSRLSEGRERLGKLRELLTEKWSEGGYNDEITGIILDRAVVYKDESDKKRLRLEVFLKPGSAYSAWIERAGRSDYSITLSQMGISQAQVSRLEKNAIHQIKKNIFCG